ncbi:MAG: nitrite/sulfite reductase [Anaerolineae bacterium]|nr:nitrite/sulfite reductase [Anaerolineae bacterium]MCB9106223.1 nitrite/sulfite reductase [Anaerolineales bacterium]
MLNGKHPKSTWKAHLGDIIPLHLAQEIDEFETQMELRRQGKVDEKVFAEMRLRRGAYGQRYDNGRRHDGEKSQDIPFPNVELTKGPDTKWEAPGMQRIKIPYGGLNSEQMDVLADIAEEYSDSILHITTRQDIQLHFISLDDTPDMHRRLAAVDITTREACGNSVRNVTACPLAGICRDEAFDVTGYANETAHYFLGHRDVQDFGRKFKVAFSGCAQHPCGLTSMHDLGLIAKTRVVDGVEQKGFEMYVGGGLGAIPHLAKLFDEFVPAEELLPLSQAIARIYARYGEKRNRNKARIKFLVSKFGIDEFRRLVLEERQTLENDPEWTNWLENIESYNEAALPEPASGEPIELGEAFEQWQSTNVYRQRQAGFVAVTLALPLGDITSQQMRRLADITRRFTGDAARTTVEQNILLRWIHEADLPALYQALRQINLHASGAQSIVDVTACPGTDTCKLGIASSRGLAGELRQRLANKNLQYDAAVRDIRIKVSGCFNSCSQHTVAEIGFFGSSRNINGFRVPHFQLILGGEWDNNAAHYGQTFGAVPSKRVPEVVDHLLTLYMEERQNGEKFREYIARRGKKAIKAEIDPFTTVPSYNEDHSYYADWADAREFTIGDIGVGECAGEVVSLTDFGIALAEGLQFEAQVAVEKTTDQASVDNAARLALEAMVSAAQAVIKVQNIDVSNDPAVIVDEFKTRFYDTELFFDPYAKGKFAHYLFNAYEHRDKPKTLDIALRLIEEAGLFIEASHACNERLQAAQLTAPANPFTELLSRKVTAVSA